MMTKSTVSPEVIAPCDTCVLVLAAAVSQSPREGPRLTRCSPAAAPGHNASIDSSKISECPNVLLFVLAPLVLTDRLV